MADWRNRVDQICNKVKFQLNARGVDNLSQLKDVFLSFDKNMNGVLDRLEFEELLSKLGVFLSRQELRTVFDNFDANKDGSVSYGEFVGQLKNDMSNERLAMVKRAWQHLSGDAASVSLESLVSKYNAPAHPRVTSREKKAETVMSDFVTLMSAKAQDGQVCEEGFCSYYADCNAVLPPDRDNYFCEIISKTWGVQGGNDTVSAGRLADMEDCIFEKIR